MNPYAPPEAELSTPVSRKEWAGYAAIGKFVVWAGIACVVYYGVWATLYWVRHHVSVY